MRYEWLEVDETAGNETDSLGILVCVAVLVLQVDFVCGAVSERVLLSVCFMKSAYVLLRGSDANDEDFAAKHHRLWSDRLYIVAYVDGGAD